MKLSRYDLHALTGAYAVDAIDDESERERFERHMRRCQQCTGEVRGLTDTATRLAFAASVPPPPARPSRDLRTGRPSLFSYAFAAASIGVAIALLFLLVGTRRQLDHAQAVNAALAAVLAAPDSRAVTQTTSDGGHATLVYSLRTHAMIFTSRGLPPPPPGKVYELWLIGPPHVRPAGLLGAGQAGRVGPVLTKGLIRGDDFGITIEPAGGTKMPTTTPILVIPLRA